MFKRTFSNEEWKQQYREWLAGRPTEKRDRPFWWEDPRWGAPTRPVVGITWFEAVAYTRWLEAQLNIARPRLKVWQAEKVEERTVQLGTLKVQLPSEAEWEKAARGPVLSAAEGTGRKYPWGDAWEENCGNIKDTGLEQTNPVGMFPDGASPYGVLEMAGNVWEWTRSRWGERSVTQADYGYPYDPDDGRERLESMKIPIVRGGSFYNDERLARCAYRFRSAPLDFDYTYGFRAVVSLVHSDC
jgi:formylglycine-generating enzyme required for sulfatase activity